MSKQKHKLCAEDMNYWQTSNSHADTWIAKARKEIAGVGGIVTGEAFARYGDTAAFVLTFSFGGDHFKVIWSLLESRSKNETAERRQAATFLYHDVKAKCMVAKVKGLKQAFVGDIVTRTGRTVSEEVSADGPTMVNFAGLLGAPSNVVEGEYVE